MDTVFDWLVDHRWVLYVVWWLQGVLVGLTIGAWLWEPRDDDEDACAFVTQTLPEVVPLGQVTGSPKALDEDLL